MQRHCQTLIFKGAKKLSLKSKSSKNASFTIENTLQFEDLSHEPDAENLLAKMYVVRHSDKAVARIWYVAGCKPDEEDYGYEIAEGRFGDGYAFGTNLKINFNWTDQYEYYEYIGPPSYNLRLDALLDSEEWPPSEATIVPTRCRYQCESEPEQCEESESGLLDILTHSNVIPWQKPAIRAATSRAF